MGGEQSVSENHEEQGIAHPKFKNIKFVQEGQILRTIVPIESEDQVLAWDRKLKDVSDCDDEYLLLPKSYTFTKKAVCGSSGIIEIDYDNYPYLLRDQLNNRKPHQNHFTETELWYLVYSMASSAFIFKVINSKIGDIRPQNIFINECGQIHIGNMCSWPSARTNYEKTIFDGQLTYLSPEQVEDSKYGKTNTSHDKFVSESFTIGVTLLEAGLLKDSRELYDIKKKSFNYQELKKRINRWFSLEMIGQEGNKQRYSWDLKVTIAALCEVNPKQRLTCESLYKWLSPHDSEIANLKAVKLGLPPLKNIGKYEQIIGAGQITTPHKVSSFHAHNESQSRMTPQQSQSFVTRPNFTPEEQRRATVNFSHSSNQNPNSQPSVIVHSYRPSTISGNNTFDFKNQWENKSQQKVVFHQSSQQRVIEERPIHHMGRPMNSTISPINTSSNNIGGQEDKIFTFHYIPPIENPQQEGMGNMSHISSIQKKQESVQNIEEGSLDFLKKINENIQKSMEKYQK